MGKYLGQHFLINKNKLREIVEALEFPPKADQSRAEKNGDTVIEIGPGHGELTEKIIERFKDLKIERFKLIAIEKDVELADSLKKWSLRATEGSAAIRQSRCEGEARGNLIMKRLLHFVRNDIASARNDGKIEIIHGDALRILSKITNDLQPTTNDYKIVGNIPYYITGYLLRILGELENKPSLIVLTVQKEVAERVCAKKGDMNLLAASVQFWAKPEIVGYISKKDFRPAPEVDSAIIKLKVKSDKRKGKSEKGKASLRAKRSNPMRLPRRFAPRNDISYRIASGGFAAVMTQKDHYYNFIKILFKQPRKTIINNLTMTMTMTMTKDDIIKKLHKIGVEPNARPQDLSIEQIKELSTLF